MSEVVQPKPIERNKALFTTLYLTKETRNKLKSLKKELGFRSYDAALNFMALEVTKGGTIPQLDFEKVFADNRPVIITGESGSGKTTAVKRILERWEGSVFVLDVTGEKFDEYPDYEKLDLSAFFALKWEKGVHRRRFIPNSNVQVSQGEAGVVFTHLNFIKNGGALANWVIVIEEGHRFSQDANLRALLIEGRKFVRKVILVTTDWRVYEGIAKVYKPIPYDGVKKFTGEISQP